MLFQLIAVHFLCDYPLQGDFIGKFKNRHMTECPVPWWHLMTAHSFIHGLGVLLVTGSLVLACIEVVLHFVIDVLKCEGITNIHTDQLLHIMCKLIYVLLLAGIPPLEPAHFPVGIP
jgi:hypothetical protein